MITTPAPHLDSLIARSCNYVLNTWWPARSYPQNATPAITWAPGGQELAVRGAAMAALTLATPLYLDTTNLWSWKPGSGQQSHRDHAARLLAAVARQHRAAPNRTGQYWGGSWQSPLWASWAGLAALVGWHDLVPNAAERNNVLAMLEYEANFVLNFPVEYWRNADSSPGVKHADDGVTILSQRTEDTAAEESTWRAQVCWTARALMPDHTNADLWRDKAYELNSTSFAREGDFPAPYGWNVDELYHVHNHGIVHPDYSTNVAMNTWGYVTQGLRGMGLSNRAFWNLVPVWDALQLAGLDAYGTRAYTAGDALVHFPAGTPSDWGQRRPHAYAVLDSLVALLRDVLPQTSQAPRSAEYWAAVHLADAGDQQFRPTTSTHPYGAFVDSSRSPAEANYAEEEVYAASQLCYLRLAQHVHATIGTGLVTS